MLTNATARKRLTADAQMSRRRAIDVSGVIERVPAKSAP
jgi:hypothetical protein